MAVDGAAIKLATRALPDFHDVRVRIVTHCYGNDAVIVCRLYCWSTTGRHLKSWSLPPFNVAEIFLALRCWMTFNSPLEPFAEAAAVREPAVVTDTIKLLDAESVSFDRITTRSFSAVDASPYTLNRFLRAS